METVTLTAIAVFLAPYLHKAGEKVAEKTIEVLFDSRKDLAEKFAKLFQSEIVTLDLSDSDTEEQVVKQLEIKPELKIEIDRKVGNNQDLLNEMVKAFEATPLPEFGGITINSKNIGSVINNPRGPINVKNTFS